ncbi:MAG: radical SAM protein [Pseudomonadota bacterium]
MPARIPSMVAATGSGEVFDHPRLSMAVWDGVAIRPPLEEELIPLPEGSDVFLLPGRIPMGFAGRKNNLLAYSGEPDTGPVQAVSAFLAPAWLRLCHPAFESGEGAPALPLFAYAPLGWMDGRFWTTGTRIDPERRQDPVLFDLKMIRRRVQEERAERPKNVLLRQLERCALEYECRAAQNYFLHRWEAPLPTSRSCNARCVGCISEQEGEIPVTQERLTDPPPPQDIAEVALTHFGRVKHPVASFGQGCEGEPLTRAPVLEEAVRLIREGGGTGTMNLNTNASRPDAVAALFDAGLDSIRISLNSARKGAYEAYHRPASYAFEDVEESARRAKAAGGFISLNLLVFPGVTDREEEVEALEAWIAEHHVDMIQWRNLNIDPTLYMDTVGYSSGGDHASLGLLAMIQRIRERFPDLRHGYFNPALR